MSKAPTVTLRFSQAIVQASERLGVALPPPLLAELRSRTTRVPLSLQDRLWETISATRSDPLIGLRMGLEIQVGHLDSAGLLLMSCDTLGSAVDALLEYFPIISEGCLLELAAEDERIRLRYLPSYDSCREIRAEAAIGCFVHLSRWMTGGRAVPAEVCLRHAPRAPIGHYQALLGCRVRFEANDYSLLFSKQDMETPLIQANEAVRSHLQQVASQMLASLSERGLSAQVEALVRHHPRWGKERIAYLLGMSGRHLTRRLAEEGSSFKLLRDTVLYRMATERLRDDSRLRDIAESLGFADESAFAKAFRRWAGVSPARFREQARQEEHG
jgi:AraC-like DNA-binding protein